MNTTIMGDWLQAFYRHIGSIRHILLTMDNFSAHASAIELYPPPSNIRICWLPANTTSIYQPLDQGIIQNFKVHYRRQWLAYMLECFDADRDPMATMNIHLAIRWSLRSWNQHVSTTTIYNCFRKSTLLTNPITLSNPTPAIPSDVQQLYNQVIRAGNIQDFIAISNFLNPADEDEDMEEASSMDDVLQEVLDEHLGVQSTQNDEEDDEQPEQPVPTLQEAQQALQILIGYTEHQDALQAEHLRALERLDMAIGVIKANSQVQSTLDRWIT
jgi:DDE superfamily endonuclease